MVRNNSFKEIWDKLKKCKKVAMTLHAAPDGDSLGSCAAMKYVLERDLKCKVTLVSYDPLEGSLTDFPYVKEIKFGVDISDLNLKDYDATIFLDSSGSISGKMRSNYVAPKDAFIITIDHHENSKYRISMSYVDPSAPSTCSLLIEFFKDSGVKFDKELSSRLLLGLCTDTLFLTVNANSALKDASFLVDHGGDYQYILSKIIYVPLKVKRYYGLLVERLKILTLNGKIVGYSSIDAKTVSSLGLNVAEIRQGPNYLSDIKELDVLFTLADMGNHIKGSFRSRKGIDVSRFVIKLGGSGHKEAAGFRLENITLKDAEKKVLAVLKENL